MAPPPCKDQECRGGLLATEVEVLKTNMTWMRDTVDAIRRSTEEMASYAKQLVRLESEGNEARNALNRAFSAIADEEKARQTADEKLTEALEKCGKEVCSRLDAIEEEMPLLKLAKAIVFSGVVLILSNSAALVWAVFKLLNH